MTVSTGTYYISIVVNMITIIKITLKINFREVTIYTTVKVTFIRLKGYLHTIEKVTDAKSWLFCCWSKVVPEQLNLLFNFPWMLCKLPSYYYEHYRHTSVDVSLHMTQGYPLYTLCVCSYTHNTVHVEITQCVYTNV